MHIDREEVLSMIEHHAIAFIEKFARQRHMAAYSVRIATALCRQKLAGADRCERHGTVCGYLQPTSGRGVVLDLVSAAFRRFDDDLD